MSLKLISYTYFVTKTTGRQLRNTVDMLNSPWKNRSGKLFSISRHKLPISCLKKTGMPYIAVLYYGQVALKHVGEYFRLKVAKEVTQGGSWNECIAIITRLEALVTG